MENDSKLLYSQICDGFSPIKIGPSTYYLKHPNYAEFFGLAINQDKYLAEAKEAGILTQEEAIANIVQKGWWDKGNEHRINLFEEEIIRCDKTLKAMNLERDKIGVRKNKKKAQAILETYLIDRRKLTNITAEEYAANKVNKDAISEFFYKDKNLTIRIEDDLSDEDFGYFEKAYANFLTRFDLHNIKIIAAGGFFRSLLFLFDEDVSQFFGRPASQLTRFQSDLLTYGKIYLNKIRSAQMNADKVPLPD